MAFPVPDVVWRVHPAPWEAHHRMVAENAMTNQQRRMQRMAIALLRHWTSYRTVVIIDDADSTIRVQVTDDQRQGTTIELDTSAAEDILGWKEHA